MVDKGVLEDFSIEKIIKMSKDSKGKKAWDAFNHQAYPEILGKYYNKENAEKEEKDNG